MAPPPPVTSTATLHALTERLATHGQSLLSPLMSSKLAASLANFSPTSLAAAAAQYRQPAPPPSLPVLQLLGRHQDPTFEKGKEGINVPWNDNHTSINTGDVLPGDKCPLRIRWSAVDEHLDVRCGTMDENDLEGFVADMAIVMRREFDCWVEQCWTESFHYLFTRTLPTLIIHLILTGATPQFLRRSIVHGGWPLDTLFQTQMLDLLYTELELRLSGARPAEPTTTKSSGASAASIPGLNGPAPVQPINPLPSRDGICFHNISYEHGYDLEEDDHCACLCQLTSCLRCFEISAMQRKGPSSLLPYELRETITAEGWSGGIEAPDQARIRTEGLRPTNIRQTAIPAGKGFVRNPKPAPTANGHGTNNPYKNGPPLFPHPQMTDVLAVEEHLRWRLKELGAHDPAVEGRYGPSKNDPAALDGVELPEESEDGDSQAGTGAKKAPGAKMVKITRGKGKVRRVVNGSTGKKDDGKGKGGKGGAPGAVCYLPKEWAEEDPQVRNMAVVLTFRHFVKLLHQIATSVSPFSYPSYSRDVEELERVHPVALYRRLAEPAVPRRKDAKLARAWTDCMERWGEELGAREKTRGNMLVNDNRHAEAVEYYTRALSLDPKKTVYLSNRAVALNTLGYHQQAEVDCNLILAKDSKNGKAFYQRALARRGQGRVREAEADLREVLRYQPGNDSAKRLMGVVKGEVAKLPKMSAKDALEF